MNSHVSPAGGLNPAKTLNHKKMNKTYLDLGTSILEVDFDDGVYADLLKAKTDGREVEVPITVKEEVQLFSSRYIHLIH